MTDHHIQSDHDNDNAVRPFRIRNRLNSAGFGSILRSISVLPAAFRTVFLAANAQLVAADSGDDFTNNLFTDIAPLVSVSRSHGIEWYDTEIL